MVTEWPQNSPELSFCWSITPERCSLCKASPCPWVKRCPLMCSWSHCASDPICCRMLPAQPTAELENTRAASSQHRSFRSKPSSSQWGGDLKRCQIGLLTHRRQGSTSLLQAAPEGTEDVTHFCCWGAAPAQHEDGRRASSCAVHEAPAADQRAQHTSETFPENSACTAEPAVFACSAANQQLWELPRNYILPQKTSSRAPNWC